MFRFVSRRLLQSIPIFFGITLLSYSLMVLAPGNPVARITFNPRMRAEEREAIALQLGVNDPVPLQYLRWLMGDDWMRWDADGDGAAEHNFIIPLDANSDGQPEPPGVSRGILRGDFGNSFVGRRPVLDVIRDRLPATFELGITAFLTSLLIGTLLGVMAGVRRGGLFDNLSRLVAVLFNAVPDFWLGLILILIFGSQLGLLPMGSQCKPSLTGECPVIWNRLEFLLLPTLVLSAPPIASYSRFMRASMLETLSKDFVRTAYAKGLANRAVWVRHGARNALIPLASLVGQQFTVLLGGAVVVETIFSWPGIGRLSVDAVLQQDFPVVMAVVILSSVLSIFGFIVTDCLYVLIDPRIRFK
jgi:peptide/nickel transport system permease protein